MKVILDCSFNHHIVFLDGYVNSDNQILRECNAWLSKSYEKHRLVVISSITSRGKTGPVDVREFFHDSWELRPHVYPH